MKAGRPRLPIETKRARGTLRVGRERQRMQAEAAGLADLSTRTFPATPPSPPADLTGDARDTWLSLAPALAARGLPDPASLHTLAELCRADALLKKAEGSIASDGFMVQTPSGASKANPAISASRHLRAVVDSHRRQLRLDQPVGVVGAPSPADGLTDRVILPAEGELPALVVTADGTPTLQTFITGHPAKAPEHLRARAAERWDQAFGEQERRKEAETRAFFAKVDAENRKALRQ